MWIWGVLAELEAAGLVTLADKGYQGSTYAKILHEEGESKPHLAGGHSRAGCGPAAAAEPDRHADPPDSSSPARSGFKPFRFHEHPPADHPLTGVLHSQAGRSSLSMYPEFVINGGHDDVP